MGATSYVLNLAENVKRRLEYKCKNDEWGGKAPLGYLLNFHLRGQGVNLLTADRRLGQ